MGQTLSSPATDKTSEAGTNARFAYSVSEMQGWRITMEDAHATVLDLDGQDGKSSGAAFFAVYDGHGGGTVAKFAGQNVHKRLVMEETYKEKQYETALKKAFLGTDEDLLANPAHTRDPSGCTAVAALVTDDKIYVANAGDSRAVIAVKGEVKPLSFDHKPSSDTEKARITAAGGYIEYGRVNGNLALSRAIGDFEFKKNYAVPPEQQVITADPDVLVHDISKEDEFLIIACDGIWDCLSSQQAVDFVRYQVSEGKDLTEIGEMMCDHCLAPDTSSGAGIGCDNMTVMIIAMLQGRSKEEWYAWVTDRVKNEYGYKTPTTLPQLYAQSRINSFKARKEAMESKNQSWSERDDNLANSLLGASGLGSFARVLGSTGGISFHPSSGILSDGNRMMFGEDDSDEDESDEDDLGRSFFSGTLGAGGRPFNNSNDDDDGSAGDSTQILRSQLEQFEKGLREESRIVVVDDDGDTKMDDLGDDSSSTSTTVELSTSTTQISVVSIPPSSNEEETTPQPQQQSGTPTTPSPSNLPNGTTKETEKKDGAVPQDANKVASSSPEASEAPPKPPA